MRLSSSLAAFGRLFFALPSRYSFSLADALGAERSKVKCLKITATGPGAVTEFKAYTKQIGDELVASTETNSQHIFFIRKK